VVGPADGADDVDVDGSGSTDVEVAIGSEESPAPASEELALEQPLAASNAAEAAQTTAFNAQRQSTETSSRGSSKPLSVSRRGSESG
jgi:hypothetical protein